MELRTVFSYMRTWVTLLNGSLGKPKKHMKTKWSRPICCWFAGVKVIVSTSRPYSVIISTPIMQRAQHLQTSSDIVFIDSSSSCDVTQTSVTLMLTASKTGAVPLAVLLHENQSQLRFVFVSNILMYAASISNQLIAAVIFWLVWLAVHFHLVTLWHLALHLNFTFLWIKCKC